MPQLRRFIVEYELPFIHKVRVGIEAETAEQACEIVSDELCGGDLFADNRVPAVPVLHDSFREDGDAGVALEPEVVETLAEGRPWPAPDTTVSDQQRENDALRACKLLVEAFIEGDLTKEGPTWNWLNIAQDAARLAVTSDEVEAIRKKVADRLGVDPDDSDSL